MNITPTLEGGLAINPESESDWAVLQMIAVDAEGSHSLASSLGELMDEASEWDQWVVPDLQDDFNGQLSFVVAAIQSAREQAADSVLISPTGAGQWYGAINQARMELQSLHNLTEIEPLNALAEDVFQAYFRDRFYTTLQSLLLEFVMDVAGD